MSAASPLIHAIQTAPCKYRHAFTSGWSVTPSALASALIATSRCIGSTCGKHARKRLFSIFYLAFFILTFIGLLFRVTSWIFCVAENENDPRNHTNLDYKAEHQMANEKWKMRNGR